MNSTLSHLSSVEAHIISTIENRYQDALNLLEEIVNIDSFTSRFEGVKAVAEVFDRECKSLGFTTEWIDGAAYERAGHFIARSQNMDQTNLPHVLLIGHLDTAVDKWHPFRISEDGKVAYGTGVCDMKGGDVIAMEALFALQAAGVLDQLRISLFLAGDEEDSGYPIDLAREAMYELGDQADIAIGFEGGDGDISNALVCRRSYSTWKLTTVGRRGHAGKIFTDEMGVGATLEISRILAAFYNTLSKRPNLTFNPGILAAGFNLEIIAPTGETSKNPMAKIQHYEVDGQSNTVAARAQAAGDLRTLTPEDLAWAKEQMIDIVNDNLPGTSAELIFQDAGPPFPPSATNEQLLTWYNDASAALGAPSVAAADPRFSGVADINFVAYRVSAALDGIGIGGGNEHREDEEAYLDTFPLQAKRAALLLNKIAEMGRGWW